MVQLVNFLEFTQLNQLRKKMHATLCRDFQFNTGITLLEKTLIDSLGKDGIETSFDEVTCEKDHTLSYQGQRVVIYIRDIIMYQGEFYLPKYHIAFCKTLQEKKLERFVVANNINAIFRINMKKNNTDNIHSKYEKLDVCKNCLNTLNWDNYSMSDLSYYQKNEIFNHFHIKDFFRKYPKSIVSLRKDRRYIGDNAQQFASFEIKAPL